MTTLHPDIERAALVGWHLYPSSRRTRHACFANATNQATADLNVLARWTREFPCCNWRVVVGPSRVWGLDLDTPPIHAHDGILAMGEFVKVHGALPPRPVMRSGGGGLAMFFAWNGERIIGEGGKPAPGIDPRRGRQSQTIPPSVHHITGKPYRWLVAPWDLAPPAAPGWLLRLLEPAPEPKHIVPVQTNDLARNRLYRAASAVVTAGEGKRNDVLNRRSYQVGILIGGGLLGEQEAIEALYAAARAAGLDHSEAKGTIRSGLNSGMRRGGHG
jgi:hypothetical protein